MMSSIQSAFLLLLILANITACDSGEESALSEEIEEENDSDSTGTASLTIFFLNDQHGQLDNFAKIKPIVDAEREETNTLLVCAGDMFSGNPIVDQYAEKGFPMIDIMNQVGFDISVIGNHEFDYGPEVLKRRMEQAEFDWVCANADMSNSEVPQPDKYVTLKVGDVQVTVLGLVETWGKEEEAIPSTHPWKVRDFTFDHFYDITSQYAELKESEGSDVLLALTHLGSGADRYLAEEFPYFDAIIGGHSHQLINEEVEGTPIFQASSYLQYLGKLELSIQNKTIKGYDISFINLTENLPTDPELEEAIKTYNQAPEFDQVVGYSKTDHSRTETGCFYTDALREYMNVDFSMQNGGGVRSSIDRGNVTRFEIYEVDPFNNGSVIFTLTVAEIKQFLEETGAGFHMSGITVDGTCQSMCIYDDSGQELEDEETLTLGMNDYIAAVYDNYFPIEAADIQNLTTAETILAYLESYTQDIDYEGCDQYQP